MTSDSEQPVTAEKTPDELFTELFEEAKQIALHYQEGTITAQEKLRLKEEIAPQIETLIQQRLSEIQGAERFLRESGDIMQDALNKSDIPDSLRDMANLGTYMGTNGREHELLRQLTSVNPGLENFSLEDAIKLANGEQDEIDTRSKYQGANPEVLMAVAYATLYTHQDEIEQKFPDFAARHVDTDFKDMLIVSVLSSAESEADYKKWEMDKSNIVIDQLLESSEGMAVMAQLQSPYNITTLDEVVEQYSMHAQASEFFRGAYSDVYGLFQIEQDDTNVLFKPLSDFIDDEIFAASWSSTIAGVNNDETVFFFYNPIASLLQTDDTTGNNTQYAQESSYKLAEELQHTIDRIHLDQLVNGELAPSHPATEHLSLVALNQLFYSSGEQGQELYSAQYIERTAKESADNVSFNIGFALDHPELPKNQQADSVANNATVTVSTPSSSPGL